MPGCFLLTPVFLATTSLILEPLSVAMVRVLRNVSRASELDFPSSDWELMQSS